MLKMLSIAFIKQEYLPIRHVVTVIMNMLVFLILLA